MNKQPMRIRGYEINQKKEEENKLKNENEHLSTFAYQKYYILTVYLAYIIIIVIR